jgi:hypothetical protein
MAFDKIKKNMINADDHIRSYVENSNEYVRLKIFKILMRSLTSFAQIFLIGSVFLIALLLLSIAISLCIGQAMDNVYYGYLIVGSCYLLFGAICFVFRRKFNKPLIRKFSRYYFEEI